MPKSRRPYPPEYRRADDRARPERTQSRSRSPGSSSRRRSAFGTGCGRPIATPGRRADGLTTDERTELQRLRRENATLREEREILKKAAAWFARETGSIPSKGSDS